MPRTYDAIVVGARCAGSPTAMLLARRGYRVLLVDRATFPSDTLSTHVLHPRASQALARWGLLDRLVATGCPPMHTYSFDFGPVTLTGSPQAGDLPPAYCPRRYVLDQILVDAASEAGVEVREGFPVEEILREDGRVTGIRGRTRDGAPVVERARVVIGADGRNSLLARTVEPPEYHTRPPLQAGYYAYWSDLPVDGTFEIYIHPHRGFAAAPTHDGLTLVIAGWAYAQFEANRRDLEGSYEGTFALSPSFAERIRGARRESRIAGGGVHNFFRKPFGPGWILVGDAGYNKDPITAQGIMDAFDDAERSAAALHSVFAEGRAFDEALDEARRARDEHVLPMYEFTCQLAAMEPPPPDMLRIFAAMRGNRSAMDAFVRMNAGTISPAEFFAPEHVASILASAPAAG